jgi:hypothetical protein
MAYVIALAHTRSDYDQPGNAVDRERLVAIQAGRDDEHDTGRHHDPECIARWVDLGSSDVVAHQERQVSRCVPQLDRSSIHLEPILDGDRHIAVEVQLRLVLATDHAHESAADQCFEIAGAR